MNRDLASEPLWVRIFVIAIYSFFLLPIAAIAIAGSLLTYGVLFGVIPDGWHGWIAVGDIKSGFAGVMLFLATTLFFAAFGLAGLLAWFQTVREGLFSQRRQS